MNHRLLQMSTLIVALAISPLIRCSATAQEDAAGLFQSKCAACHGADGSGNTAVGKSMKIRDFHSPEVQKQTDAQLTEMISAGKGAMPSYKGKLTDEQIKQLVGYIRELGKK
jgi:mono/diheme cytochrome c family protein